MIFNQIQCCILPKLPITAYCVFHRWIELNENGRNSVACLIFGSDMHFIVDESALNQQAGRIVSLSRHLNIS